MGYYRRGRYYVQPYTEYKTDLRGRTYSVRRGGDTDGWSWGIPLFCGVMLVPFTYGISLLVGIAAIVLLTHLSRTYE